ncbi:MULTISPECIES: fructose bisphosphate aldolase [Psychrobacter]|jgi:fructose-bisphosphate aldolase class I|uniref:fructose-bisphosphate aldolase n=1 Tax=Psychrobacter pocilloporae TaxID=1775882 RepID=A0ABT6IPS0_9GAMM|nr:MULTISPECIES: fructose bisphosphate aldolase [Psychrobacter]MDH4903728.1 fructose bisphosphate aldolase [Psychrobacter pocilloporae]|tara:strand:- start:905 stop:1795 length:891 start_codon:yes stop_codon:yes gene_type:complete
MEYDNQLQRIKDGSGFIAALDQSGGSTPKALENYGISGDEYENDEAMFDLVHEMRARIMTCDCFDNERVLGAILFEDTMERDVNGKSTANYLWEDKQIVPFLKVDKGLAEQMSGVQVMKPMPNLDLLLDKAKNYPVFGTKMRSVIYEPNVDGIELVVQQQFDVAKQIISKGLMPIVEPEVNIDSAQKHDCEVLLKANILRNLERLNDEQQVMLKLTLPEEAGFYQELVDHPKVLKAVALSGGYSRTDACAKLKQNPGMIASFSRAFTEGLSKQQSDEEFADTINTSIEEIYQASKV